MDNDTNTEFAFTPIYDSSEILEYVEPGYTNIIALLLASVDRRYFVIENGQFDGQNVFHSSGKKIGHWSALIKGDNEHCFVEEGETVLFVQGKHFWGTVDSPRLSVEIDPAPIVDKIKAFAKFLDDLPEPSDEEVEQILQESERIYNDPIPFELIPFTGKW